MSSVEKYNKLHWLQQLILQCVNNCEKLKTRGLNSVTLCEVAKYFSTRTCSSNQSGVVAILAFSSFLKQITHQKETEISLAYI